MPANLAPSHKSRTGLDYRRRPPLRSRRICQGNASQGRGTHDSLISSPKGALASFCPTTSFGGGLVLVPSPLTPPRSSFGITRRPHDKIIILVCEEEKTHTHAPFLAPLPLHLKSARSILGISPRYPWTFRGRMTFLTSWASLISVSGFGFVVVLPNPLALTGPSKCRGRFHLVNPYKQCEH
jgi:hypothetical protein